MRLRQRMKDPKVVLQLGLIFLVLASLAARFLHPSARLDESFTDGVKGLLYGLAIGFMLLSVHRRARRRSNG